jgi:hypothetical protein
MRKPWANPEADFDDVMSKLAIDHWVDLLLVSPEWIARSPYRPPHSPIPPGDRYMIDELRALARAPWEAAPWPDPPNVNLDRLSADYERTTGRRVDFSWRYELYPYGGFWSVDVSVNGEVVGGTGRELSGDPETDLVALTDALQSEHLGEEFEGDWPRCQHHPYIVMLPEVNQNSVACWVCQVDSSHQMKIGALGVDPY